MSDQRTGHRFAGKPMDSECFYGYHAQCHGCNCTCHEGTAAFVATPPAPSVSEADLPELPPLEVTDADWQDTGDLFPMATYRAAVRCRERQLIACLAKLRAAESERDQARAVSRLQTVRVPELLLENSALHNRIKELEDAIKDHISDGEYTGLRLLNALDKGNKG